MAKERIVLRACAPERDLPAILGVWVACREGGGVDRASVVEPYPTPREVEAAMAAMADPRRDQVLAEHEGSVVGHATVGWWREGDAAGGTAVYLHRGRVVPHWWGRGVGTALVRWAEERIAALVAAHGTAARACFAANASDAEPGAVELLTGLGYRRVFGVTEFEWTGPASGRTPPPAALPGGAELRPVTADHYRPVWEMVRAAYADTPHVGGWDFGAFAAGAEPAHWQVAWEGGEVVGAALCVAGREGGPAEVRELSVRKDRRRRGLGRALLLHGLHALTERGERGVRLFTGSANPYRSWELYESVGFRRLAEFGRYRKAFGPAAPA
ncbi:GNAT family N-acetyltransferase [Streptomyces hoynatensis]|uniref:GNAT family N-acetyltransferase n=1 Tax=Streptomyces hoynatensis TaxID=1141874 RepID=UPI0011C35E00|nr:GNAT family N-acetyltransferase [Streptomyces hoynatensis]